MIFLVLLSAHSAISQCLMLPNAFEKQLSEAHKIIEGKVVGQSSFMGQDGNIYTTNEIEVYRVFKGQAENVEQVITQGGVHGNLMQIVTPSVSCKVGDYGLMTLDAYESRVAGNLATTFYPIETKTGLVYGLKQIASKQVLYDLIARYTETEMIELKPVQQLDGTEQGLANKQAPQVSSIFPADVTAGTQTVLTINGQGFGNEQGSGHVAFTNADDGGQSFVSLQPGPHYLSWTDTEIQLYVPSSTLYSNTVAGTGNVRVTTNNGQEVSSAEEVTVAYAKSEVVYNENLNSTMLVDMLDGGYEFSINDELHSFLSGSDEVAKSLEKWSCNTGVNFTLNEDVVSISDWAYDDVNVIGFSLSGQLPSYMLGRTITTFSSCGTPNGLQWNLIEVDVLLNSDINWWVGEGEPSADQFDLPTSLLHELGHAHLLQHNNDRSSPMYFQLTAGSSRRTLNMHTDIDGGSYVSHESAENLVTCGDEPHQLFDASMCNLSVINSAEEYEELVNTAYPNPFSTEITLRTDQDGTTFVLRDVLGKVVMSGIISSDRTVIGTSEIPSGLYLLEINRDNHRTVQRLVKN